MKKSDSDLPQFEISIEAASPDSEPRISETERSSAAPKLLLPVGIAAS